MTIGAERPPYGTFHARLSPAGDHFTGRFFSDEMPSRAGPRHSAQSLAETNAKARQRFKKMEIRLVILEVHHQNWIDCFRVHKKAGHGFRSICALATLRMYNT